MSTEYFLAFLAAMKNFRKLESYKDYITIKKGISNVDFSLPQPDFAQPPKMLKKKNYEIIYDVAKEW